MSTTTFINRRNELDLLQSRFESETAELLVIHGRRQLGKSTLVREAMQDRDDTVYCCFCRSGFSDGLQDAVDNRDDVSLFTPEDIVSV